MLLKPWFLIALSLATAHQLLQKIWTVHVKIVDSFLDPLLFLPIILHLTLLERRFFFGIGPQYVLPWFHIFLIVGIVSVVCEVLFPRWSDTFTADYLDTICYTLGAVVFGIFFNVPLYKGVGKVYESDTTGNQPVAERKNCRFLRESPPN